MIGGNEDPEGVVLKDLAPPPVARALRVYPRAPRAMSVCLRLELYGCPWDGERRLVTSPLSPRVISTPPHHPPGVIPGWWSPIRTSLTQSHGSPVVTCPPSPAGLLSYTPRGDSGVVVPHPHVPHPTPWWPCGDGSPVPSWAPVLHGTTGTGHGP